MITTLTHAESHERAIERETDAMVCAQAIGNKERARKHWINMRRLIKERSERIKNKF